MPRKESFGMQNRRDKELPLTSEMRRPHSSRKRKHEKAELENNRNMPPTARCSGHAISGGALNAHVKTTIELISPSKQSVFEFN
jgi:hypothetical protein